MQYKLFKQRNTSDENLEFEKLLVRQFNISPLAAKLLSKRGISSVGDAEMFLYPKKEHLYSPFLFRDMQKSVDRIWLAYERGEKVTIYGDYDCDGVCATAIIYTALKKMGCDVDYYIPDRFSDGYGMNELSIRAIANTGTTLIITVDNGITAVNEIDLASQLGIDVILTDHHSCPDILPECFSIINPKVPAESYPFEDLCGAGIAYKLATALDVLDEQETEKILILAGIASIADLVSLSGENRTLSSLALTYISQHKYPAITALAKKAGIDVAKIQSHEISFQIAPRINAAGRLYSADMALELLISEEQWQLKDLAEELDEINTERKDIERYIHEQVNTYIEQNNLTEKQKVIFVKLEDENEGVIGIAAGKAAGLLNRPVIIGCEKDGFVKASARSVSGFDIYEALKTGNELFVKFGGHSQAAGFTIAADKFDELAQIVNRYADSLDTKRFLYKRCMYDLEAVCSQLTTKAIKETELFAPFGISNPKPVYKLERARFSNIFPIGKDKTHFRAMVTSDDISVQAVAFNMGSLIKELATDEYYDILFTAGIDTYRKNGGIQLEIKEIMPHIPCPQSYYESLYGHFNVNFGNHDNYIIPDEKYLPLTVEGALDDYENTVYVLYGKDTLIRCLSYAKYQNYNIIARYGKMNTFRMNAINILVNPVGEDLDYIKGKRIVVLDTPCYFALEKRFYEHREDVFFLRASRYSAEINFSRNYVLFIYKNLRILESIGGDINRLIGLLNTKATFRINYFSLLLSLDMMQEMGIIDYNVEGNILNVEFLKISSQKDINSTAIMIELNKKS
ncbi:MAG: single-stranded-DNA-specific exonuclease RecJ [Anaerofustis stercorihominis]|nr:single-stranded-DNA-specific exonuclease RecJ [Anaerofustis stercorihominis]